MAQLDRYRKNGLASKLAWTASSSSRAANFVRTAFLSLGAADSDFGGTDSEGWGSWTGAILLFLLAGACTLVSCKQMLDEVTVVRKL